MVGSAIPPIRKGHELIVVNFSHPLTASLRDQLASLTNQPIDRVIDVPTHFDTDSPFAPQVEQLVGGVGLSGEEWQTSSLLINLPAYAPITATLLAHLHGVCGYFPTAIRLRQTSDIVPPVIEVAELLELQAIRTNARRLR